MKLHLGFENYPYAGRYETASPLTKSAKSRRPRVLSRSQQNYGQGKTTLEVANELESRYHIVETFWEMVEDEFVDQLEESFADDIEEVIAMGGTSRTGISDRDTDRLEAKFRQYLQSRKFDGVIPGVPTTAALRGVSHLRQHPYAKRPPRPSFIDTGMYQRSFRVWVEDIDEDDEEE